MSDDSMVYELSTKYFGAKNDADLYRQALCKVLAAAEGVLLHARNSGYEVECEEDWREVVAAAKEALSESDDAVD